MARCPYSPQHNSTALLTSSGELYAATAMDFPGRDPAIYRSLGALPPLRTAQYNSKWLNGECWWTVRLLFLNLCSSYSWYWNSILRIWMFLEYFLFNFLIILLFLYIILLVWLLGNLVYITDVDVPLNICHFLQAQGWDILSVLLHGKAESALSSSLLWAFFSESLKNLRQKINSLERTEFSWLSMQVPA